MQELIDQLNEPDKHFPGNFDTPKRANALLMCLCQEAAEAIKAQAEEIASLQALWSIAHAERSEAMLDLAKCRSICDQLGAQLDAAIEHVPIGGYGLDDCAAALEAWRAMK